jgi:chemotaxis response regulator CheB
MIQPVRVVVANRPRLMRELVLETIAGHPDIQIVAEIYDEKEIVGIVDGARPDVLIIALDNPDERPPLCDAMLHSHPGMKILALAPERNLSIFYWASLDIHSSPVETSQVGILSALRHGRQYVGG